MPVKIDETGHRYGSWTVLYQDKNFNKTGGVAWVCRCDCGTIKSVRGSELRKGRSKSCGHCDANKIIGKKFGKLLVLNIDKNNSQKMICQCECGKQVSVWRNHLIKGNTKSCNNPSCKIHRAKKDLTGKKFGKLTVLKEDTQTSKKGIYWICRCDCGTIKSVFGNHLKKHIITSCGCNTASRGEECIEQILKQNNIKFIREKQFQDLVYPKTKRHPRFDFYVEDKYVIEFDGRQHFEHQTSWGRADDLEERQWKDEYKNQYCFSHNIPIIRIPYTHLLNITLDDLKLTTSKFVLKNNNKELR